MSRFTNRAPQLRGATTTPGLVDDPPIAELKGWWYNVKRFQMQQAFHLQNSDTLLGLQIRDEVIAREDGDAILASEIESIVVTIGGTSSKISVQSFPPTPPVKIGDLWVDTSDQNKTKYWDGVSWVWRADEAAFAAISTESTVRASEDSLLATQINTVIVNYQSADAALTSSITTESTTRANADSAMATQITTIDTQYKAADNTLQANITTEATTRANADTALANQISTIQAGVGNRIKVGNTAPTTPPPLVNDLWLDTGDQNKYKFWDGASWVYKQDLVLNASITTESNTRASADGNLSGKYTLTVAAGNVVTGMNITSSTSGGTNISDVTFVAANFKIYNGFTGVTMFNVSGSTVTLANTLVVSTANKVFIGAGNWSNPDTSLYIDANGYFSLKNLLVFDPATPALTIAGTLNATAGFFGNSSSDVSINSNGLVIGNSGSIVTNGVSGIMTGTGIFLGFDGGYYKFRVGDPNGAYILWDGLQWHEVNFSDHLAVLGSVGGGGSMTGSLYANLSPSLQITVVCDGKPRVIQFISGTVNNASGTGGTVRARIVRDGNVTVAELGNGSGVTFPSGGGQPAEFSGVDTPSAGSHTYSFQMSNSNGAGAAGGGTLLVT